MYTALNCTIMFTAITFIKFLTFLESPVRSCPIRAYRCNFAFPLKFFASRYTAGSRVPLSRNESASNLQGWYIAARRLHFPRETPIAGNLAADFSD